MVLLLLPCENIKIYNLYLFLYSSWPHVAIETTGEISITECTCQVPGEAKCCHVAALLYLLEAVKRTGEPLLCQSTTDTSCYWAKVPILKECHFGKVKL